jgi:hypothetical protein
LASQQQGVDSMKAALLFGMISLVPGSAWAADATCASQADDKKLAGAALTSFMKKCTADAQATCDKAGADKKLAGAALASFTKKCVADATGN